MSRKASTETAEQLEADHTQAAVGQDGVSPPYTLEGGKSGVAQAMEDFARAQKLLRTDFFEVDWPQAKFALDRLAVLAVQYKSCMQAERLLFRSEIKTLCSASIARLHTCSNLFINLRRCRNEIQEEFSKISIALLRDRIRRKMYQDSLPTTDPSTRACDSHQKRDGAMTAASQMDRRSASNSGHAPPPGRA